MRRLFALAIALLFSACSADRRTALFDAGAIAVDTTTAAPLPDAGEASDAALFGLDAEAAPDAISAQTITTLRVHYPAGAHTIALRGSRPPFSWDLGVAMVPGADDTWTIATASISGELEWKPLLDDATWS